MREDLVSAIKGLTDRGVVALMSENHIDFDMAAEVFILEPESDEPPPNRSHRANVPAARGRSSSG
jgi:hypothetical protein